MDGSFPGYQGCGTFNAQTLIEDSYQSGFVGKTPSAGSPSYAARKVGLHPLNMNSAEAFAIEQHWCNSVSPSCVDTFLCWTMLRIIPISIQSELTGLRIFIDGLMLLPRDV